MGKKIEAETDDIRVRKSVEANDPSTVIIAFRISSERDDPVAIELRDPIPGEHDVQVQSGTDGEWTVAEEVATYECVLRPDETATTGYKSTASEDQALDSYSTAPSLDVTAPPADVVSAEPSTTEPFTRGASDAVFSFRGPENETPEHPTQAGDADDEKAASKPRDADPTDAEATGDAAPTESGAPVKRDEAIDAADEFDAPGDEMDVAELVTDRSASTDADAEQAQGAGSAEADDGTASSDDPPSSTDRAPEGVGGDGDVASSDAVGTRARRVAGPVRNERSAHASPSLEVRVQYLQSRFHELAAYIDAMEEFIDEHGDGEHVLTTLSDDVERVQERLDRLDDQQEELRTHLEAIDDRVTTLDERTETIDDDVYALAESLDRMEEVQQAVKEDVESLNDFREKLQNAI